MKSNFGQACACAFASLLFYLVLFLMMSRSRCAAHADVSDVSESLFSGNNRPQPFGFCPIHRSQYVFLNHTVLPAEPIYDVSFATPFGVTVDSCKSCFNGNVSTPPMARERLFMRSYSAIPHASDHNERFSVMDSCPFDFPPFHSASPKLPFVAKLRDKLFKRPIAVVLVHVQPRLTPWISAQHIEKKLGQGSAPWPLASLDFLPRLSSNRDSVCGPSELKWTYAGGFFRTVACWTSRPWLVALLDDVLLIFLLYYWILRP